MVSGGDTQCLLHPPCPRRAVSCSILLALAACRGWLLMAACGFYPAPGDSKPGTASPGAEDTILRHILGQFSSDKCLSLQVGWPRASLWHDQLASVPKLPIQGPSLYLAVRVMAQGSYGGSVLGWGLGGLVWKAAWLEPQSGARGGSSWGPSTSSHFIFDQAWEQAITSFFSLS